MSWPKSFQVAQSTLEKRIRDGNAYVVSSGKIVLAGAANMRMTLENPSGSGKVLYLYNIIVASDIGAMSWADFYLAPTTGLPGTSKTPFNMNFASSNTSVALAKGDTNATALSGGTALMQVAVPGLVRTSFDRGIVQMPANTKLGINTVFGAAVNASVELYFWEE